MPATPDALIWSALLGKWTEFARAALAVPREGDAGLVRRSVPDVIGLQAITFALADLDSLSRPGERALALDRAELGIRAHEASIRQTWSGRPLHPELFALLEDAHRALAAAAAAIG